MAGLSALDSVVVFGALCFRGRCSESFSQNLGKVSRESFTLASGTCILYMENAFLLRNALAGLGDGNLDVKNFEAVAVLCEPRSAYFCKPRRSWKRRFRGSHSVL